MVSVKILADSINPAGKRLTSFLVTYPRIIHAELMTHRVFSRNAASSRAIPTQKALQDVIHTPALPVIYTSKQKGMQGGAEISSPKRMNAERELLILRDKCVSTVEYLELHCDLAKQDANRYIEAFGHITVLITASDAGLANFFMLRAHPAAQPVFQKLAYTMLAQYIASTPREIAWDGWHIPQFENALTTDDGELTEEARLKVATARCLRLSYLTFDGEHSIEKDIARHDDAVKLKHWSAFEHCAQAVQYVDYPWSNFDAPEHDEGGGDIRHERGLSHWMQYRKTFPGENVTTTDLNAVMASKPDWILL